jgi:putative ABC transport system permease protein
MRPRIWLARIIGALAARRRDARLEEEIQAHLDALAAAHEARGLTPADARLAAKRDFGAVDRVREAHRALAGLPWLDAVQHDLVVAVRRVAGEPAFSVAVVAALAIGIGGAVAVVGAVTAISMATPPFRDPGAVMAVSTIDARGRRADVSWPDYVDWRDQSRAFAEMAAFASASMALGSEGLAAERVFGSHVTANTFGLLGLAPMLGRDFAADDDRAGAGPVAILGANLWEWRFGSDPAVIGRVVTIDGVATTVIGVMPPEVTFPLQAVLWMPMAQRPGLAALGRERRTFGVIGRLAAGTGRDAALAELVGLAAASSRLAAPAESPIEFRPTVAPFNERFLGRSDDPVPLALLGAAAMLLAIGCATAATLLFARSAFRVDEMAMRTALGATRGRLVQQLLLECTVLTVMAGAAGLAGASLALDWFARVLSGSGLPPWVHFGVDGRVTLLAVVVCAIAVLVGGLAPAWRLAGAGLRHVPGGSRATSPAATRRWIGGLVVAETALTLMLLAGAAHLGAAAVAIHRADQVIATDGVITAQLSVTGPAYATPAQRGRFYARYLERLRQRGEVAAASAASAPPFSGTPMRRVALDDASPEALVRVLSVDAGYFATLGLSAIRGRLFGPPDPDPDGDVVVVNARFAAMHGGDAAILGRRIRVAPSPTEAPGGTWRVVIGVTPSVRQGAPPDAEPVIYLPLAAEPPVTVYVMVRAASGTPVAAILRDELQALDRGLPLFGWQSLAWYSEMSRWTQRTIGSVVGTLGALALTLSALGVYAVTAYAAARRTKEAGIRIAIGATRGDLVRLFARGAAWPAAAGVGLGLVGAVGLTRALQSLLPEAGRSGAPVTMVAAALVAVVAVAAAVVPARRVAHTNPVTALRCD